MRTSSSLESLAGTSGSDKARVGNGRGYHGYTRYYERIFKAIRKSSVRLLEIGVEKGRSMKMWQQYFSEAEHVYGIGYGNFQTTPSQECDSNAATRVNSKTGCTIYKGDQSDVKFLNHFIKKTGGNFDVIIDNGSHVPSHQLVSFETLWPAVKPGGIYIVEDIETNWWKPSAKVYGYSLQNQPNVVEIWKGLVESVNREFTNGHSKLTDEKPDIYGNVVSVEFGQNIIIFHKALKGEETMLSKKYRFQGNLPQLAPPIPRIDQPKGTKCLHAPQMNNIFKGGCSGKCSNVEHGRLFLVVAYCKGDASWLEQWTDMDKFYSITIVNKCKQTRMWPKKANVIELDNYGGCDHTYAWWNARNANKLNDNDIVFFLKDNNIIHQTNNFKIPRSFEDMVKITNTNGFACFQIPSGDFSIFHDVKTLMSYHPPGWYTRKGYRGTDAPGEFDSLRLFTNALGFKYSSEYTPVCYGGNFAALGAKIKRTKIWTQLEYHLGQGGHHSANACFTERLWASILQDNLSLKTETDLEIMLEAKTDYKECGSYCGIIRGTLPC